MTTKPRRANFTHFGKGPRKTWVLRLEGAEPPEPGEQVQVFKRPKEGQPDAAPQVKTVARVLWPRPGQETASWGDKPPVWLCAFLSKTDEELLALAHELASVDASHKHEEELLDLAKELGQAVIRKLIGADRPQEEAARS